MPLYEITQFDHRECDCLTTIYLAKTAEELNAKLSGEAEVNMNAGDRIMFGSPKYKAHPTKILDLNGKNITDKVSEKLSELL